MELKDNELIHGDSRTIKATFKKVDGSLYDLTGATAYLTLNKSKNPTSDGTAAIQKIVTDIPEPESGIVRFKIIPADWENVDPGTYWFDVQLVDAGQNKLSRKREEITVIADITRS